MIPLRDDNPTELRPVVTVIMITVCTLVFVWETGLPAEEQERIFYGLGMVPGTLLGGAPLPPGTHLVPAPLTLVTSMFLHGGWLHLIGNMLYLWIFGNNVEDAMGHWRFLLFYLLTGVLAALAQALADPDSTLPMIGASGAISGVLGAYLVLYPQARVLVAIPIGFFIHTMRVPAWAMIMFWFFWQVFGSLMVASTQGDGGGVAFLAHLGGFFAGMLLVFRFRRPGVGILNPPSRS